MNLAASETVARPRIAIVGGGISGLAAAHRLLQLLPRVQLSLFEASERLGGVLDTVERDGFLIERSADNFLTKPSVGVDLCRQLGFDHELITTDESRRRAFVVRAGKLIPIPDGFYLMSPRKLWPLLMSPALSWNGKLRLLAEPLIPSSKFSPYGKTQRADESIAAFVRRRLGREAFERLVQPLVAGIYTADPEQLSMAATMPQFLEYERDRGSLLRATLRPHQSIHKNATADADSASGARYGLFVAPKNGMRSLVRSLADHLPKAAVQLDTTVTRVSHVRDAWQLEFEVGVADCKSDDEFANPQSAFRDPQSFDALILALPTYAAARLLKHSDAALAAALAAIEYAGCAVVSLGFARRQIGHPLDGFGFVVPHIEGRRIIAASFASLKYACRAAADDVLIRVFIGGALQPELLDVRDDELTHIAREELRELLKIVGEPLVSDVARWPRSMPQYHVGHLDRVARIEQLADQHANFALAGNAYRGVGIPQCIASGQAAAERIAAGLSM